MSIFTRRQVSLLLVIVLFMVVMFQLMPVWSKGRPREINLVAQNMTFYLEDNAQVINPVINVFPGEHIRVVLKNEDRGMTHYFSIPSIDAATAGVSWNHKKEIVFVAPMESGAYDYICHPHLLKMRGILRVQ